MGKDANLKAKNVRADGVFARKDAAGRTDRGRCRGALGRARGLARKSCGKSRKSGCVFVRCPLFSGGTSRLLRDGWATWRRFRSWPFAPQAPGGAAAEWIVALCLLRGGSSGADDNCCAASAKATKGAVGLRRRNKKTAQTVTGLSEPLKETGGRGAAELFAASARCRMTARGVRRRSAECCMRRRGGRALEA